MPYDATNLLILGIDGGGTRTRARLANARGETLGNGEAGTANPNALGFAAAQAEMLAAVERAFQNARIEKQLAASVCLGIGGVDRPDERLRITEWAESSLAQRARVVNDGELVLTAGTPDQWGVGLIAGTGSIAWGKSRDGRIARAGGWGYMMGDEGSGFDLAREALRAVVQSADGRGAPTQLLDAILAYWQVGHVTELIPRVYRSGLKPGDIAALAPVVIRVAEEKDPVAQKLVERAAVHLGDAVVAVTRTLGIEETIPVAFSGGLLLESVLLRAALISDLQTRSAHFGPFTLVPEPVVGAVKIAVALLSSNP